MKFIYLLLLVFSSSCANHSPSDQTKEKSKVYLHKPDRDNKFSGVYQYRLKDDKCNIQWSVYHKKESDKLSLSLIYHSLFLEERKCKSFSKQIDSHKEILAYIFKKHSLDKFKSLTIPSIRKINPTKEWNQRIAEVSSKNKEWLDYTRNYPNHKSRKSSNILLVETINNNELILSEFRQLFLPHLSLELKSVEKVFAYRNKDLIRPVKDRSVGMKQRLMTDAGIFYFKLIKKN